jgi:hypothetical protein
MQHFDAVALLRVFLVLGFEFLGVGGKCGEVKEKLQD